MKRLVALMLSVCLLAGCGGGSASASSGTETAPQPAPTAAPQTLTVCAATGSDTAAVRAVEGYAQAQGVTLEYTDDAQRFINLHACMRDFESLYGENHHMSKREAV